MHSKAPQLSRELREQLSQVFHTTTILRPFFWDYPGVLVPEEKLLNFMQQGKINRGRHTDHPAGRHSIPNNQCPLPRSSHIFTGRMSFLPPSQQRQSTESIWRLPVMIGLWYWLWLVLLGSCRPFLRSSLVHHMYKFRSDKREFILRCTYISSAFVILYCS